MDADDLVLWIKHLLKRQFLIQKGELRGPLFAFRKVHPSIEEELEAERKARKSKKGKSTTSAKGKGADEEEEDDDDEEIDVDEALKSCTKGATTSEETTKASDDHGPSDRDNNPDGDLHGEDDSSDDDDGSDDDDTDDDDEDDISDKDDDGEIEVTNQVKQQPTVTKKDRSKVTKKRKQSPEIDDGSPASIPSDWASRLAFLRSLSKLKEFHKLVNLLPDEMVGFVRYPQTLL